MIEVGTIILAVGRGVCRWVIVKETENVPVIMCSRDGPELMIALTQTQMATQRDTMGLHRTFAVSVS